MAALHGHHFIAGAAELGGGAAFAGVDPATGDDLAPGYAEASAEQVERARKARRRPMRVSRLAQVAKIL